jgi:hypothetical protein
MNRTILVILFLVNLNSIIIAQVDEKWGLLLDNYFNSTSNYHTDEPCIDIAHLSNSSFASIDQNNNFIKIDSLGKIGWKIKLEEQYRSFKRIATDSHDNIVLSFDDELKKFDNDGKIIWAVNFDTILSPKFISIEAISINYNNEILVIGEISYTKRVFIVKFDSNGKVIFSRKFRTRDDRSSTINMFLYKEDIYLIHGFNYNTKSTILKLNHNGRLINHRDFDFYSPTLKSISNALILIGNKGCRNDKLFISKINEDLNILYQDTLKMPQNADFLKESSFRERYFLDSVGYGLKRFGTCYYINDFIIDSQNCILIAGQSFKNVWIGKINNEGNLLWSWDKEYCDLFKYNNLNTIHSQFFSRLMLANDQFIVTGLSYERDNREALFVDYINLFIKSFKYK